MTTLREAAQQALDYWEQVAWGDAVMVDKMDALRAALAEQKCPCGDRPADQCPGEWGRADEPWTPLYTSPPAPQPLTDEELDVMWRSPMSADWEHREYGRLVEAEVLKRMGVQR